MKPQKNSAIFSIFAGAVAAAVMATAAQAEIQLSVNGLDFRNPADLAAFNEKLQAAAQKMCADQITTGTRVASQPACIRGVIHEAFDNLDKAHKREVALAGDKIVSKGLASN